jgi:Protein of unknown function DUF262
VAPTDDELDLGENDNSDETFGFPPPERKISTASYDLSVNTLVEQWNDKLLIIPEMQREYVWDDGRASRLIESLMLNIPVPPVFFAETEDATYEVIDGHQRITSIVRFIENQFPLSGLRLQTEYLRKRFHQLPPREQRFLRTRVVRAVVIGIDSHPQMKFEIFRRLNTGAIALNSQEVRHALNQGPLDELLRTLVLDPSFRRCVGTKTPRRRMIDQELVLRFLSLSCELETYRPPLERFLNGFMEKHRNDPPDEIAELAIKFRSAVGFNGSIFPGKAFRWFDRGGHDVEPTLNRALFDAQMVTASWVTETKVNAKIRRQVLENSHRLFDDLRFVDSIQRATGDRRRILDRIRLWAEILKNSEVELEIPSWVTEHAVGSAD